MITKMATIAVYVSNQQEALTFWTEKVGFEVKRNQPMGPDASWIELTPPQAQTCLVIYPKSMMPDAEERKPSIVFETANIQETYAKMKENGVDFLEEPNQMPWGTYARFVDPDGNEFLLKE
ncbi:UNVERIFIED_CONTAM: lactoylglutathione lyase [Brevibacillus sp. OAP136]